MYSMILYVVDNLGYYVIIFLKMQQVFYTVYTSWYGLPIFVGQTGAPLIDCTWAFICLNLNIYFGCKNL
jgi:hypothetical protein